MASKILNFQRQQIKKCLLGFTIYDRFLIYRIMFDEYVEERLGFSEFNKYNLCLFLHNRSLKNIIVFHVAADGAIDFKFPVIVGAKIGEYK